MVGLIADRYDTTTEHANLIVGTIGDARPGYSAGDMNHRGRPDRKRLRHLPDRGDERAAAHG